MTGKYCIYWWSHACSRPHMLEYFFCILTAVTWLNPELWFGFRVESRKSAGNTADLTMAPTADSSCCPAQSKWQWQSKSKARYDASIAVGTRAPARYLSRPSRLQLLLSFKIKMTIKSQSPGTFRLLTSNFPTSNFPPPYSLFKKRIFCSSELPGIWRI